MGSKTIYQKDYPTNPKLQKPFFLRPIWLLIKKKLKKNKGRIVGHINNNPEP